MINLLLGPPGGGKSFEAVVYHVLPALRQGRRIITNLPLVMDEIIKIDVKYSALVILRHSNLEQEETRNTWNAFHRAWDKLTYKSSSAPFSSMADYGDPWRHPVHGFGPLYVIDECHKALRAKGTKIEVEEWFAEHRHENADVLLITQSYGKVSKAIIDLCQVVYRVKKATALGAENHYIRKVQDGLRGEVVNEGIRKYNPAFFKFYKSNTKSAYGAELAASDIVPFWKRWPVIGAGLCGLGVIGILSSGATANPMKAGFKAPEALSGVPAVALVAAASAVPPAASPAVSAVPAVRTVQKHPFDGFTIHITGYVEMADRYMYSFQADQNGQGAFTLSQASLEKSGYLLQRLSPCSVMISYRDLNFYAVCDMPTAGLSHNLVGNS